LDTDILVEDICNIIDQHLKLLTSSRTLFLIFVASVFFVLTLIGLILIEEEKPRYHINLTRLEKYFRVFMMLWIMASIAFYFLYVFKATTMYRLPMEYFVGWLFYDLLILTLPIVIGFVKSPFRKSSEPEGLSKTVNVLIAIAWIFMILGLTMDTLSANSFASEDTLDILTLVQQGHLFKSMHAPLYDLAPMHVFLYVTISQILGLQIFPKTNTYSAMLITFLLLLSMFLMFRSFIGLIGVRDHSKKRLLIALIPILLTLHPYALGILSASHVNGLSGVLALLIVMLLIKNIIKRSTPTASQYIFMLLMLTTSILMHPIGFVIIFFASLFLIIALKPSINNPLKHMLTATLTFALILFTLKAFYTGAFQSLQTFTSYMLETLFKGFLKVGSYEIEISPRTYQKVPISSNGGYVASLGVLTAITLYVILQSPRLFRRSCDSLLLFAMLSNVLILVFATTSFFIVVAGTPTKYVIGSYVPVISLTVLLYLATVLKKREVHIVGLFIIVLVLILSSLASLISPLKTPTNYRILQGSVSAIDNDISFAIELSSFVEHKQAGNYVVIQYAFTVSDPQEHNIEQALAVYIPFAKFYVKYGYNESEISGLNIVFTYWRYMLDSG